MKKLKFWAIFDLILIGLSFIGILVGLIIPSYALFFAFGCVLVIALALGFVIKGVNKKRTEENENTK